MKACRHSRCAAERKNWRDHLYGIEKWLDAFAGDRKGYLYGNCRRAKEFLHCAVDAMDSFESVGIKKI